MEKLLQDIFSAFDNFKKDATANIEKNNKAYSIVVNILIVKLNLN